jgi:hypothetical protein
MRHESIKKAVIRANLPDADVALRALDRIDKDETFRDALTAVIDADGDALKNVIYGHFAPVKHKHGDGFRSKPSLRVEQLGVNIDAEEVVKLVNDHALEALIGLLSNDAIEKRLVRFVEAHMEAIVLGIMGLEKDSYRGYRPTNTNNRGSVSGNAIHANVREKMQPILMAALEAIDLSAIADDVVTRGGAKQLKDFYKQAVADLLRSTARARAEERAKTDVETFMKDFFGDDDDE